MGTYHGAFVVAGGVKLTLSKLTVQNSRDTNNEGALYIGAGEAIVDSVEFLNNTGDRGAIFNWLGTLTVRNTTFKNNSAPGCAAILSIGAATITNSTFIGNKATAGAGGAICSSNTFVPHVFVYDRMFITNSTFFGNSATGEGGAILANSNPGGGTTGMQLRNVTFDSNSSPFGAHIGWSLVDFGGGLASYENTIFSNPLGGGNNCLTGNGKLLSLGHNISSDHHAYLINRAIWSTPIHF